MKLYRLTGNKKHLDLAAYFINERGQHPPHYFDVEKAERERRGLFEQRYVYPNYEYSQSHRPVREQDKVVGHAVRAMYLYAGMADLAFETGDPALKRTLETLWNDVMATKMYVTAGLGPSAHNEGFTHDYDLPNQTAYAETCASVALIFWAQRMLHLDLDGKYADILELALFNGALSGLSRDGEHYFYANPLESNGSAERWEWHTCPCCTMNVSRLVASVGGYFLSDRAGWHRVPSLWRHLDHGGERRRHPRRRARNVELSLVRRHRASPSIPRRRPRSTSSCAFPAGARPGRVAVNGEPVKAAAVNWLRDAQPHLAARRYDRARPARHAGRAALRASGRDHGRRPRRAASAGRWSIASRRPTIPAASCSGSRSAATPSWKPPRVPTSSAASSLSARRGTAISDDDWSALYRTSRSREEPAVADRRPLLPLGQSRKRLDGGVGAGGLGRPERVPSRRVSRAALPLVHGM